MRHENIGTRPLNPTNICHNWLFADWERRKDSFFRLPFFRVCAAAAPVFRAAKKGGEGKFQEKRSQFGKEFSLGPAYIRGFTLLRQSSSSERGNAKLGSTEKELVRHYSAIQPSWRYCCLSPRALENCRETWTLLLESHHWPSGLTSPFQGQGPERVDPRTDASVPFACWQVVHCQQRGPEKSFCGR